MPNRFFGDILEIPAVSSAYLEYLREAAREPKGPLPIGTTPMDEDRLPDEFEKIRQLRDRLDRADDLTEFTKVELLLHMSGLDFRNYIDEARRILPTAAETALTKAVQEVAVDRVCEFSDWLRRQADASAFSGYVPAQGALYSFDYCQVPVDFILTNLDSSSATMMRTVLTPMLEDLDGDFMRTTHRAVDMVTGDFGRYARSSGVMPRMMLRNSVDGDVVVEMYEGYHRFLAALVTGSESHETKISADLNLPVGAEMNSVCRVAKKWEITDYPAEKERVRINQFHGLGELTF